MRPSLEGVGNIVRFNWPYYFAAAVSVILLVLVAVFSDRALRYGAVAAVCLTFAATAASLLVSWYVYDHSGFYSFAWLGDPRRDIRQNILNINAGFDETTSILKELFPNAKITACDFYEGERHTAASIRRARTRYPPAPGVKKISSDTMPFNDASIDRIFAIMAVHEIRDPRERVSFFIEAKRCLAPDGQIVMVEHVRNGPNFLAYNIGAFHFHSRRAWQAAINGAGLEVDRETKLTPFLTAFFIKHGDPS